MTRSLHSMIPDPEDVLSLEPEELAGVLLEHLNSLPENEREALNRYNFSLHYTVADYPDNSRDRISCALMEAWVWLEREGMIVPKPGSDTWSRISRRGERLKTASDVDSYNRANLLPKRQLHPAIAQRVWATFLRGDYDTAVFQAFREVEVRLGSLVASQTRTSGYPSCGRPSIRVHYLTATRLGRSRRHWDICSLGRSACTRTQSATVTSYSKILWKLLR